jgi:hypothetical protein
MECFNGTGMYTCCTGFNLITLQNQYSSGHCVLDRFTPETSTYNTVGGLKPTDPTPYCYAHSNANGQFISGAAHGVKINKHALMKYVEN